MTSESYKHVNKDYHKVYTDGSIEDSKDGCTVVSDNLLNIQHISIFFMVRQISLLKQLIGFSNFTAQAVDLALIFLEIKSSFEIISMGKGQLVACFVCLPGVS